MMLPRFSSAGCRIQSFYHSTCHPFLQLFPFPPTSFNAHSRKRKVADVNNRNITYKALTDLLSENTKHLVLAHISRECNDYQLVSQLAEARLAELKRDIAFHVARQDAPLDTIALA